ncbi:lipocalin family protein [Streptomyces coffeae]|uniref:AttH domain-containing protein n=1 Tax=Streptomyces coffeae TaxID=621382 RepID=A0ABS1NCK3_9ACTN|nr:lipocalin family protein [Streptomyces coffeae]MBL1097689.1 hypothetical protein [Streptomyces coffeae]
MKRTTRITLGIASATAATAATALLGATAMPTAQAADGENRAVGSENRTAPTPVATGIPSVVDPAADLAAQTPGPDETWTDSIYINGEVKADGHDFGLLVHTMNVPHSDQRTLSVSVTDVTTGWYKSYESKVAKDDYIWSKSGLNIKMPGLSWTGDAEKMSLKTTTPWGSLDIRLKPKGPAMKYAGTGEFPLLGEPQVEFAYPSVQTTGTLNIEGKSHKVSGETWLDRQWGNIPRSSSPHWTWMNFNLPNGDKIAIWDSINSKAEESWATVLHPDGSYDLAAVKPLAEGADRIWKSPDTGKAYPTRWRIEIPALKAHLNVRMTGTNAQELTGGLGARVEGTAAFAGTYEGKKVSGKNFVEMTGAW